MHRTSTSSQEDTDTKSSDDNDVVSSSRINGLRGESEEGRDGLLGQVLQRQRELLKQEDALFGEGSGFESVLEKQQQLLRAQIQTSRLKKEDEEMRNTNQHMISLRREQLRREQLHREQANNSYHRPFEEQGSYLPRPNMMYAADQPRLYTTAATPKLVQHQHNSQNRTPGVSNWFTPQPPTTCHNQ